MAIQFTLEENEAKFIVDVIGNLPNTSGAYVLWQKLQMQATTPKEDNAVEEKPAE